MTSPSFILGNTLLAPFTSYGIGGAASFFAEPMSADEIEETYEFAARRGLPVLTLGGGSNLLVDDRGVDAVVMRLRGEAFSRIEPDADDPLLWRVGAAAGLPGLVDKASFAGLRGLEALAGIPGRVGGAAAMNAGSAAEGIGAAIVEAEGYDATGKKFVFSRDELAFRYRGSALLGRCALRLALRFVGRDDPSSVAERVRHYRERKFETQPVGQASAGCVFKNPPGSSAGMLLDESGCKGMREGGAEVSRVHANFIVNAGGARSGDVARLAARMRERVFEATGTELELEIQVWGKVFENA